MMSIVRFVVRIAVVAAACALATMWLDWVSLPIIGFIYGIADRLGRARGTVAAVGAALGWLAILAAEVARGVDVRAVAQHVGGVLQVPGFIFAFITIVFAALLCGTAAVLGSGIDRFRVTPQLDNPDRTQ